MFWLDYRLALFALLNLLNLDKAVAGYVMTATKSIGGYKLNGTNKPSE
jgi:hypothetical protein